MSQRQKLNIIKVPNDKAPISSVSKKPEFPRMPRMYLELIENKEKIKPNLVNKEYDPDEVQTVISRSERADQRALEEEEDLDKISEGSEEEEDEEDEEKEDVSDEEEGVEEVKIKREKENDQHRDEDVDQDEESDLDGDQDDDNIAEGSEEDEEDVGDMEEILNEDDEEEDEEDRNLRETSKEDFQSEASDISSKRSIRLTKEEDRKKNQTREKLKEILKDPPRLSELEERGEVRTKRVIPNMKAMGLSEASLEEEDELKRELLFKFELLKRSYKNVDIPEFNMHSDYKNMNKTYENTLRRVSLDSNVENYKNYMIAGFMLMEYILGFWLKFDMAGFTQQQILNMNQYERLLIELGEKSYVPDDRKWPVEIRLLGMIILNAVIFIISKMIMKQTGTSLFGLMDSQKNEFNTHKPKRKMKGPNIDFEAIPDIEEKVPVSP